MTQSRAWQSSAAVAGLVFGLNFPDPNLAGGRAPLPYDFTVLAADQTPGTDPRQVQSDENADESAKMGKESGMHSGDEGGAAENDTKKDRPTASTEANQQQLSRSLENSIMSDIESHIGEHDRGRDADDQDYEVRYLAEKQDLSVDQVRSLIARFGNDREKIEAAVRQLNS